MAESRPTGGYSAERVARFARLQLLRAQTGHSLKQEVADLIWSRKLLPVLTRADAAPSPFGTEAPVRGAGDLSMTYAVCPPGTGPTLHAHRRTFETFTVLQGRFRFFLGDEGDPRAETVDLDPFDVISVPPGLYRAFQNIGSGEGILQVLITGGIHDVDDIVFPASTAAKIAAIDADALDWFRKAGLEFLSE